MAEFLRRKFRCFNCDDYPFFENEAVFRKHQQQVHKSDSFFQDYDEDTQLRSLDALEIYAKASPFQYECSKQIVEDEMPCGCMSKHMIEDYDYEKKRLFFALHSEICHKAVFSCNKCGIVLSERPFKGHTHYNCNDQLGSIIYAKVAKAGLELMKDPEYQKDKEQHDKIQKMIEQKGSNQT